MSKYETYKPSGIDWIGNVPKDWEIKRLKDIANVTLGKMLQNDDSGSDDLKPYLRSFNVQWDRVDLSEVKEMWLSEYEQEQYLLKKFDLVVSEGGEVGRCAIWLDELEECYIQNSVHKVTCNKRILPYFLLYQFTTAGKAGFFEKIINKVSIGHLTREKLVSVNFVLPPIEEQLTIANYLDDQTQKIDCLIANKKAQAEKLKELRQIEINNAVTKGLNPNAAMKDSGIVWLGKIPKHWEVKRLKNVSKFIQTGITPPSEKSEYYDGDIPWYGPSGFSGDTILSNPAKYITQKAIDDNEAKLFPIDCIFMIGIGATIGKVGIIKEPSSCNQQLNIVNFKNYVSPDFGVYLLKTYENIIIKIANFSTLPIYNQVQTGNLKFLLPPKEEQLQIAKYLQDRTTVIDKLIKNIETQIEKLQELRKIKIYEAVTGKIKVNAYEQGN